MNPRTVLTRLELKRADASMELVTGSVHNGPKERAKGGDFYPHSRTSTVCSFFSPHLITYHHLLTPLLPTTNLLINDTATVALRRIKMNPEMYRTFRVLSHRSRISASHVTRDMQIIHRALNKHDGHPSLQGPRKSNNGIHSWSLCLYCFQKPSIIRYVNYNT